MELIALKDKYSGKYLSADVPQVFCKDEVSIDTLFSKETAHRIIKVDDLDDEVEIEVYELKKKD